MIGAIELVNLDGSKTGICYYNDYEKGELRREEIPSNHVIVGIHGTILYEDQITAIGLILMNISALGNK